MKKIELLAPGKNLQNLKIAYKYGADAVYIGERFYSLRARNTNFSLEQIIEAKEVALSYNKKLYIALNMLPHNEDIKDLEKLKKYIKDLSLIKVDAFIVSDLYLMNLCKEIAPQIELHISTQASITNKESANFFKRYNSKRVILARECSLEDIKDISSLENMESEVFIHGGMCMAYSGRCLLSNYMTSRDANRGGCAHSCRWYYDLLSPKGKKIGKDKITFSSKDLQAVDFIYKLIKLGVSSLKIEGRMKSEHYLAIVVSTYRKIIDSYYNKEKIDLNQMHSLLSKAANRDTSTGFFEDMNMKRQNFSRESEIPTQDFLAKVLSYDKKNKIAKVEQRNYFKSDEEFEIFGSNKYIKSFKIKEIWDEEKNIIKVARHAKQILYFKSDIELDKDDMIRRK